MSDSLIELTCFSPFLEESRNTYFEVFRPLFYLFEVISGQTQSLYFCPKN